MTPPDDDPILPDGEYDVIVVEASDEDEAGQVHLAITILSGEHRSDVVEIAVAHLGREPFDLLGLPGTLTVTAGTPHLSIDD